MLATTSTRSRTTASLPDLKAEILAPSRSRKITNLTTGGTLQTASAFTYDSMGRQIQADDTGTNVPERCTTTTYADNTTTWIRTHPAEKTTSTGTCPTPGTPPATSATTTDTRTYYDGSTTLGTIPGPGDTTQTLTGLDQTGGIIRYGKTTATYDSQGRPHTTTAYTSATDTTGRTTTLAYTPTTGGALTQIASTNALNQTSTKTVDPGRGVPTAEVDVAGIRTDATYDQLGRLTAVWNPGQHKGTDPATQTFSYLLRSNGPLAITTQTLVNIISSQSYVTSISLYDALGQPLQTQADAEGPAGYRTVSDTYVDSHGWTIRTNNRWYTSGAPTTTLVTTPDANVDTRTLTSYDGAGRATSSSDYQGLTLKRTTGTVYGGDRTSVIAPTGGTNTTTIVDARGNTTKLSEFTTTALTGGAPSGASQDTLYTHDTLGRLTGMTDPGGAAWTYTYDLAGRQTAQSDPDAGATTTSYLDTGEVATTTDARNTNLTYSYDALGRKTSQSNGTTQLASWLYDTLQAGKPTSSTRYTATGNYVVGVAGYDTNGRPTGTTVTIPAGETGLAGTYTTGTTWTATGLLNNLNLPATPGVYAETILHTYTRLGNPTGSAGINSYTSGTTYDPYGDPTQLNLGINQLSGWLTIHRDVNTNQTTETNLSIQTATPQVDDYRYTYNQTGDLTKTVDTQGNGTSAPVETTCYTYDALRQLTQAWSATDNCAANPATAGNATVNGPQPWWTSWAIDAAGDRTQQVQHSTAGSTATATTTNYTYNTPGHAHAVSSTSTTGGTTRESLI